MAFLHLELFLLSLLTISTVDVQSQGKFANHINTFRMMSVVLYGWHHSAWGYTLPLIHENCEI